MYSDNPSKFVIHTLQPSCIFMEPNSLLSFLRQLNPFQMFSSLGAYTPASLMYFPLKLSTKIWKAYPGPFIHATFPTFYFHRGTESNTFLFYKHQQVYYILGIINKFNEGLRVQMCRHVFIVFVLKIRFHSLYSALSRSLKSLIIQFYVLQINDEIWVAILHIMSVYLVALAIDGVYSHFYVCLSLSLFISPFSFQTLTLQRAISSVLCVRCGFNTFSTSLPCCLSQPAQTRLFSHQYCRATPLNGPFTEGISARTEVVIRCSAIALWVLNFGF